MMRSVRRDEERKNSRGRQGEARMKDLLLTRYQTIRYSLARGTREKEIKEETKRRRKAKMCAKIKRVTFLRIFHFGTASEGL